VVFKKKLIIMPRGTEQFRIKTEFKLKTLVGKYDEHKSKMREDALLITSQHDCIYLQPRRKRQLERKKALRSFKHMFMNF
jgi:hypothetical protein